MEMICAKFEDLMNVDGYERAEAMKLLELSLYAERTNVMKKALNYDPESAVPSIPEALVMLADSIGG